MAGAHRQTWNGGHPRRIYSPTRKAPTTRRVTQADKSSRVHMGHRRPPSTTHVRTTTDSRGTGEAHPGAGGGGGTTRHADRRNGRTMDGGGEDSTSVRKVEGSRHGATAGGPLGIRPQRSTLRTTGGNVGATDGVPPPTRTSSMRMTETRPRAKLLLSVYDLDKAFRRIPIKDEDAHHLLFRVGHRLLIDRGAPMGLATSPAVMCAISTAMAEAASNVYSRLSVLL
jgi:hypothetical protein